MDYTSLASPEAIERAIAALQTRNIHAHVVQTKQEALEKITQMIPPGVSVMNGSSTTLQQIGYIDYLAAGKHGWNNLKEKILAETDPAKQALLRKQSVVSDYYLGSVHGVAETGEMVIASNSGSQLPHIVYTSQNLIFVVGTHKIVPTLAEAIERVRTYVLPLEDQRMKSTGASGSQISKLLIFEKEPVFSKRNVQVIFVNEALGF